jgi:hypothetical protein
MHGPPRWLMIVALAGNLACVLFGSWLELRLACAVGAGILIRSLAIPRDRPARRVRR